MNEVFKLLLDMGLSAQNAEKVIVALEKLRAATQATADTYEVLDTVINKSIGIVGSYSISTSQADTAMEKSVRTAMERTAAERALNRALEETTAAQGKFGAMSRDTQMRILNLGRATQDLAQGGFAGILNNIEGIVGGAGPLAGILTAVGTAAFLATPYIKEWVKSLGVGSKEVIPEATDRLVRLAESLKKSKEAIEEKKKAGELDYFEMQKYIELLVKTRKEEEELATAREARSVTGADSKANRARASAFREAVGEYGGGEKLIGALVDAGLNQKQAESYIAGAQKGYQSDIASIQNVLRGRGAGVQIGYTSPEDTARAKRAAAGTDAALKANADRIEAQRQANEDARQAADNDAKRAEQLAKERQKKALDDAKLGGAAATAAGKAATKKVEGTDIDEWAAQGMAQMQAAGGIEDRFGRFHEATPQQINREVARNVEREIARRFPGMSRADRSAAARNVTSGAQANVQEHFQHATAEAMNAGLDATTATQQAVQQVLMEMQMLRDRARQLEKNANGLKPQQQPLANNGHN